MRLSNSSLVFFPTPGFFFEHYSASVRVPRQLSAVAGDDDVARPGPDAGVPARHQVGVAGVAGEPLEPLRQRQSVPLSDTAGPADVPPRAVVLAVAGRRPGEVVEPFDALGGDGHGGPFSPPAFSRSVFVGGGRRAVRLTAERAAATSEAGVRAAAPRATAAPARRTPPTASKATPVRLPPEAGSYRRRDTPTVNNYRAGRGTPPYTSTSAPRGSGPEPFEPLRSRPYAGRRHPSRVL